MTENNQKSSGRKNFMKYTLGGALALATIGGTFSAHERDFPPFYVRKTSNSRGICVGFRVDIEKGAKFVGPVFAFYTKNSGEIYGANISIVNVQEGSEVNGIELALIENGLKKSERDMWEKLSKVNGLQASLLSNISKPSDGIVQIGIFNEIRESDGKTRNGFLFNYSFSNQYTNDKEKEK